MKVKQPRYRILYNQTDITRDVSANLLGLEYEDAVKEKADQVEISLDDTSLFWSNEWYPTKGDTLTVEIGYDDQLVPCGVFDIDEVATQGPPDQLVIRGLSASIRKGLRTRRTQNYEGQSLRAIAQKICSRTGLRLEGEISSVTIERKMQNRETDLRFLARIASEYGYVFSVRGDTMTFTEVYGLEAIAPALVLEKSDLISFSFVDKTAETYRRARVSYDDPDAGDLIEGDDDEGPEDVADEDLEMWIQARSVQNADRIAKAGLHEANTHKVTGSVTIEGNPLSVSGNNIELRGLGVNSGVYHIETSKHSITPVGGYVTSIELKKVGEISREFWVPRIRRAQNFSIQE